MVWVFQAPPIISYCLNVEVALDMTVVADSESIFDGQVSKTSALTLYTFIKIQMPYGLIFLKFFNINF